VVKHHQTLFSARTRRSKKSIISMCFNRYLDIQRVFIYCFSTPFLLTVIRHS